MRKILFWLFLLTISTPAFADSQGSATGGTRGTQSTLAGFTYNVTPPSLTDGQQVGQQCDASGRAVLAGSPSVGPSTDISGTITSGGVYQTVAAASLTRKNCTIQNPTTATEVLNVKIGTMASPYTLSPGASISSGYASDAITVTAATTSHAFSGTCQ